MLLVGAPVDVAAVDDVQQPWTAEDESVMICAAEAQLTTPTLICCFSFWAFF